MSTHEAVQIDGVPRQSDGVRKGATPRAGQQHGRWNSRSTRHSSRLIRSATDSRWLRFRSSRKRRVRWRLRRAASGSDRRSVRRRPSDQRNGVETPGDQDTARVAIGAHVRLSGTGLRHRGRPPDAGSVVVSQVPILPRPVTGRTTSTRPLRMPTISSCRCTVVSE